MSEVARQALADGVRRSSTIARLVESLDTSNVIVFVDTRVDPSIPTGETMLMVVTEKVRYVHVILNPRMTRDDRLMYLGHELQHAVEIASDAGAVDGASMRKRFAAIGREVAASSRRDKAFETEDARLVSIAVRREITSTGRVPGRGGIERR